jgi:hypothetical protein
VLCWQLAMSLFHLLAYDNADLRFVFDNKRHYICSMRQNIGLFEELDEVLDLIGKFSIADKVVFPKHPRRSLSDASPSDKFKYCLRHLTSSFFLSFN